MRLLPLWDTPGEDGNLWYMQPKNKSHPPSLKLFKSQQGRTDATSIGCFAWFLTGYQIHCSLRISIILFTYLPEILYICAEVIKTKDLSLNCNPTVYTQIRYFYLNITQLRATFPSILSYLLHFLVVWNVFLPACEWTCVFPRCTTVADHRKF